MRGVVSSRAAPLKKVSGMELEITSYRVRGRMVVAVLPTLHEERG